MNPLRYLLYYFLRGLLYTIPIGIIIFIIINLFNYIDNLVSYIFPRHLQDTPGLGIAMLLLFITLMGVLGSTFIAKPIRIYFNKALNRTPLLKTIYTSIQDLLSAFVGKKKSFRHPALVKVNKESDVEKLGFVTRTDLKSLGISDKKVAVYLPHSYNFSGNLFIVPTENVTSIDARPSDVMKFIISGGVSEVDQVQ